MNFTDLTEEQLASNFERVAKDFYKFIKDNGLESTAVSMKEGEDKRSPELNLCDTPACHGGWAAIMSGSEVLAEKLGFSSPLDLEWWADNCYKYWGNSCGGLMFEDRIALSKPSQEALSLKDIPDWCMGVAKRLRDGGNKVEPQES